MYDELVKDLRENHDKYFARDMEAADAIEELVMKLHGDEAAIAGMKREIERMVVAGKPRWIPVTERLPKADEHDARGYAVPYLVMNGWMRVTARRTKDYRVLFGNGTVLEYVTHWMQLPQPPKEG